MVELTTIAATAAEGPTRVIRWSSFFTKLAYVGAQLYLESKDYYPYIRSGFYIAVLGK